MSSIEKKGKVQLRLLSGVKDPRVKPEDDGEEHGNDGEEHGNDGEEPGDDGDERT